jgi:transcriptional regulator with XRE-family HTH domain
MNTLLADYVVRYDIQQVVVALTALGFTNLEIADLAGSSARQVSDWRAGRRAASQSVHARLELALQIAQQVEDDAGEGYGRKFFFYPLEKNSHRAKPYILLRGENPELETLRELADGFKERVIREDIPSTVSRTTGATAAVVYRTGVPAADFLFARDFTVHQICRLIGVTDFPTKQSLAGYIAEHQDDVEHRLKLAASVYLALVKVHGNKGARQLLYWDSLLLKLKSAESLAELIGSLPAHSPEWPGNLHQKIQTAINWLKEPAHKNILPVPPR